MTSTTLPDITEELSSFCQAMIKEHIGDTERDLGEYLHKVLGITFVEEMNKLLQYGNVSFEKRLQTSGDDWFLTIQGNRRRSHMRITLDSNYELCFVMNQIFLIFLKKASKNFTFGKYHFNVEFINGVGCHIPCFIVSKFD